MKSKPFPPVLSVNQVVAYNLARAREHRGWTQEEAATQLWRYLGYRWSKATFSAAERSVDGRRLREFNANELVAFAFAFDLPLGWFLIPPPGVQSIRTSEARPPNYDEHGKLIDDPWRAVTGWSVDYILRIATMSAAAGTLPEAGGGAAEAARTPLNDIAHSLREIAERIERQTLTGGGAGAPHAELSSKPS